MTNLITWCLAGALAASMAWNVRELVGAQPTRADDCAGGACAPALQQLDLTPEQQRVLSQWNDQACSASEDFEALASKRSDELFLMLGSPDLDPGKARALAAEVGTLRGRALQNCVDSIVAIRQQLRPAQVELLLKTCCQPGHKGSARDTR
jgi:hypothetical protein